MNTLKKLYNIKNVRKTPILQNSAIVQYKFKKIDKLLNYTYMKLYFRENVENSDFLNILKNYHKTVRLLIKFLQFLMIL